MAHLKAVDLVDDIRNIAIAGSFCIQRQYLFLQSADILCAFRDQLRLVLAISVTRNIDLDFPDIGLDYFRITAVPAIASCPWLLAVFGLVQFFIKLGFQHIFHCIGE